MATEHFIHTHIGSTIGYENESGGEACGFGEVSPSPMMLYAASWRHPPLQLLLLREAIVAGCY